MQTSRRATLKESPTMSEINLDKSNAAKEMLLLPPFYGPRRGAVAQSKWFEDFVKGWNGQLNAKFEFRQEKAIPKSVALSLALVAVTGLLLSGTAITVRGAETTEVGTPRAQTLIVDALDGRVNNPTQMNPYLQSTLFNEVSINWRFRLCGKWTPLRASSSRRWPPRCLNRSIAISPPSR